LKDAEKDLSKLQAKNKKEKFVSLGRDKMGKRMSETAVNTTQSSFIPPHNNGLNDLLLYENMCLKVNTKFFNNSVSVE